MKTKIVSFCAAALFFTAANVNAQSSAQIKAGINLANVSVTDNGKVDDANQLTSFQVGIIGDIPLAGDVFSFQPGVLFTGKGTKSVNGDPNSSLYSKATSNPYYIEIPANFVFKAPLGSGTKLFAGAGPYLGIGVAGKTKIENSRPLVGKSFIEKDIEFSNDDPTTLDYEEGAGFGIMRRFDYGLNGTAGIEGKTIVLGVNYGLGLAKLQSGSNNNEDNNNKHRVLSFTVGFKL